MAVVLMEGFDHLLAANLTAKAWGTNPGSMVAGRFGGQAASYAAGIASVKSIPSAATYIAGVAIQPTSTGVAVNNFFRFVTSVPATISAVRINASGLLEVVNSSSTVIATGTTALIAGNWYYVEFKLFVNGASGTCEVRLNGAAEIASTVGNFGSTNIAGIQILGGTNGMHLDDIYVVDTTGASPRNTFLGDVRVATLYATADGAHSAWTPNTGTTHWTQVSEAQADGDTSYVSDATPNDLDTYAFGDVDTGATIYGVQTNLYARKDDASTRQIAPVIRQSGTDNVGTTVTLSSSYVDYTQLYNQDPSSADWTPTNVNADEFGVKEIA